MERVFPRSTADSRFNVSVRETQQSLHFGCQPLRRASVVVVFRRRSEEKIDAEVDRVDPHVGQVMVESRTQRIGNRTGGWKEIRVDREVDLVGRSRNLVEHDGRVAEMNSHVGTDLPVQRRAEFWPDHEVVVPVRADVAFQSVHASDCRGRHTSDRCGLTALNIDLAPQIPGGKPAEQIQRQVVP